MAQKTCLTSLLMMKDITTFPAGALSLFLFGGTITNRGEHVEWENNKSIATSPRQQQRAGEMREASVIVRASHRSLIFFFLCRLREGGFRLFISRLLFPFSFLFFLGVGVSFLLGFHHWASFHQWLQHKRRQKGIYGNGRSKFLYSAV